MTEKRLFDNLIENGIDANTRYKPSLSIDSRNPILENVDKLFINTMEEIVEAKEQLFDNSNDNSKLDDENYINRNKNFIIECCDILNYGSTIVSVLLSWINDKFDRNLKFFEVVKSIKYYDLYSSRSIYFNELTQKYVFDYVNVRRNFPERRWHHNDKPLDGDELYNAIYDFIKVTGVFIYNIKLFLEFRFDLNNEKIWEICNNKHIERLP